MANTDARYGFRPVGLGGAAYNGATERCMVLAADAVGVWVGDAVKLDPNGVTSADGCVSVAQIVAGDPVYGVVTSFEPDRDNLALTYVPVAAQTNNRFCQVAPVNDGYFMVQDDGTIGIASAGLNATIKVAAGSTASGLSGMEIDSTTEATTNTLDLQLVGPVNRPDNDPTAANADWIVRFNDPQTKHGRTGIA